jgi:adenylate cyclase
MERKLTAILSADVEGYSRLMGDDEEATVKSLNTYREAMSRLIEEHQGRVIDSPGDNLLAEFTSAVNAVQCAVVIQAELRARNIALTEDRRMNFRIGVNLGDVIVDGDRIYGDGVNVAARVESLAEGGGICVSGTVYDQVANKLSYTFDDLGEHTVKNIAEPVRVYAVRWDVEKASTGKDKSYKLGLWIVAVVLVLSALSVIVWRQVYKEPISLPPTEIPSIAVLPFRDMSPEKDQEYFCEGIAEEILNALAQVEGLRVAARTSSFRLRDESISTIGEQLNVKTVLEGSVRKEGNNIRITAQLNNAVDEFHLWSKNYDRELKSVFDIQDEIAHAITKVLKLKLMGEAGDPLVKHHTEHIKAYDQYLLGRYLLNKRGNLGKQSEVILMAAKKHFEQAISLDPNYALAYTGLADVYLLLPFYSPDIKRDIVKAKAEEAVIKALALDPDLAEAHSSFGHIRQQYHKDLKGAEREYRRAIELNPKYATAHYRYSALLRKIGDLEESLVEARKAYELEPFSTFYSVALGWMFVFARQYDAAIRQFERTLELDSNYSKAWRGLGVAFLYDKRFEEATRAFARNDELEGVNKEPIQLFVSLVEEHERTGEPVSPTPELEIIFAKEGNTHILSAALGHKEKTLAFLEQKYEEENYLPLFFPVLDFLRAEPRFIALEQKRKQVFGLKE